MKKCKDKNQALVDHLARASESNCRHARTDGRTGDKVTDKVTDKDDPEMSKLQGQAGCLPYLAGEPLGESRPASQAAPAKHAKGRENNSTADRHHVNLPVVRPLAILARWLSDSGGKKHLFAVGREMVPRHTRFGIQRGQQFPIGLREEGDVPIPLRLAACHDETFPVRGEADGFHEPTRFGYLEFGK